MNSAAPAKKRHIVVLRFFLEGPPEEKVVMISGVEFQITTHLVGWKDSLAQALIKRYDGFVDAIAIASRDRLSFGEHEVLIPRIRKLLLLATKSPIFDETDLEKIFASWCVRRLTKSEPEFFRGAKILFHCAGYTSISNLAAEEGAKISSLDPLVLFGQPLKIKGKRALGMFYKGIRLASRISSVPLGRREEEASGQGWAFPFLSKWIKESDIFVSNMSLIRDLPDYDMLKGKTLLIDYLTPEMQLKLDRIGIGRVIEWYPRLAASEGSRLSFSLLKAVIDQLRLIEAPEMDFDNFALEFINRSQLSPIRMSNVSRGVRRCAFVIHPLSRNMIFNAPGMLWLKHSPEFIKQGIESLVARAPAMKIGEITGIKSTGNGQEVVCDLYAMMATPREMLAMNEEAVYSRLVRAAENAREEGSVMIGLGAYTKVVGDSGVTVARRAPLPVTTGNSYTVAATLWAAHEIVRRMGIVESLDSGKKLEARAVVIGATGSIGRVCSLLLARAFSNITIVAPGPAKLLELKDEIESYALGTKVHVTTNPNLAISDADLIITATSARGERILDISQVKPGAVICDCSRPLDISVEEAKSRPDVIVIESGEIELPGTVKLSLDIGLPGTSVYACLAETVLLTLEGRFENFSLSRQLSFERVKEIYQIGIKHGARLSTIRGPMGVITDEDIATARDAARARISGSGS